MVQRGAGSNPADLPPCLSTGTSAERLCTVALGACYPHRHSRGVLVFSFPTQSIWAVAVAVLACVLAHALTLVLGKVRYTLAVVPDPCQDLEVPAFV